LTNLHQTDRETDFYELYITVSKQFQLSAAKHGDWI